MAKTVTVINMGSGKSWSGTPNQIWAQLFLDVKATEIAGCRSEDDYDAGRVSPARTLRIPDGFESCPKDLHGIGAWESWGAGESGGGDLVMLNDGPSTMGVGCTKIRNSASRVVDRIDDGDTVNIVGHSRGGWVAWPQGELIAASGKAVTVNMNLIDPVRRAFSMTHSGSDAWLSQYKSWGIKTGESTQVEPVSDELMRILGRVEVMYMSNTTANFPKLELRLDGEGGVEGLHRWVMFGKHGSATNSSTNPYLCNFVLWLIQRFLHCHGTVLKDDVRFKTADGLDEAFVKVRMVHQVNASNCRVWDPGVQRKPSVLPQGLATRLGVDESYHLFPPQPVDANADPPDSAWANW